jgi:hypothetical protein
MVKEDKVRSLDRSQAKVIAYIVVFAFLAIMLVFGIRSSSQTPLHEGDERRSITCQWCEGSGTLEGERCKYCLGAKKLKAIIPGPNHPLRIRGTVWNLGSFDSKAAAEEKASAEDYEEVFLKARPQTVGQAKLTFKNDTDEVVLDSKVSGRFWGFIPPGEYTLTVEHPDFPNHQMQYTVPVREHPVWPQIPGVEIPDEDQLTLDIFLGSASGQG